MGLFRGARRFLDSLDCRSDDLQDAVVVDATLPGKTTWQPQEPQYHGFRLWTRGGRKVSSHTKSSTSGTADVSNNSSFGSNLSVDSNHSGFHDASKSPLPESPSKPLKSILAGSTFQGSLPFRNDDDDDGSSMVAVLTAPLPTEDGSTTLYSMGSAFPMSPSRRSVFSCESSIMDMSTIMHDTVVEEETVEFISPTTTPESNLLTMLRAIEAPKIVAANEAIEQEEQEEEESVTYSSLAGEESYQEPRKIPSLVSEVSEFTYTDIADHVDPEQDFQSIVVVQDTPSGHSRHNNNNYLSSYLMQQQPTLPQRRGSMGADDDASDISTVTFMSRAQLERSLEEAIPERIKLSTISNVEKANKIASKIRKLRYKYSKQYSIAKEDNDGNSSIDMLTLGSDDGTVKSKCLLLLLDPKRRTFDFIHVDHFASACTTAQDFLDQIPLANTTDFGLRFQKYAGLVHGSIHGKEALTIMKPHQHVPERFSVLFEEQESPLVAIPEGFTAAQAHALARILFAGKRSPARKAFDEMQEFLLSGLDF